MKKILAIILSLMILCCFLTVSAEQNTNYDCSDWAKDSIEKAYSRGLLNREKEYDFKADISRQEFCELIFPLVVSTPYFQVWYEENKEEDETQFPTFIGNVFTDTENESVRFLQYIGIVNGKTETEFAPNDTLTREEAATIIVRMMDITSPIDTTAVWYEYVDNDKISDWALSSVQRISNMGYMHGVGENKFDPQGTYTVEQAVVTVVRVFDANFMNWLSEILKMAAGELGYVYENDTWNYVTFDMAVGRRVKPIDTNKDEFKVLENNIFAVDSKNVYIRGSKIEGADPATFQPIDDTGRMKYAKDKDFVYLYLDESGFVKVIGADPETFEVLEFPYAKDKNDAYNGCLPLYVDDVTKFEVVEPGDGWVRISYQDSFLTTALNSEEVAKYNNEKYGFIDSAVIYSEEGKAKTETLVYEGYRLVSEN